MSEPVLPSNGSSSVPLGAALDRSSVEAAVSQYIDPYLKCDYLSANAVTAIEIDDSNVSIDVQLEYPAAGIVDTISEGLRQCIEPVVGSRRISVNLSWAIARHRSQHDSQQGAPASSPGDSGPGQAQQMPTMSEVKNIIAVASGKGGVGKSTSAVNLALALKAEGANVGILDADIYGPSQSLMLGVAADLKPEVKDGKYWVPVQAHGLQAMSMGFLVDENTPMVWRGPMVSGALQQMVTQTLWRDLDYLIVDMPPGTGDIQLTLAQRVPVSGAVIVTTPQDIALLDAKKGIEMFSKVGIPVLGILENMSVHICSQCGHAEPIFGAGGGERIAAQYGTQLLGALPLALEIREQTDSGDPTVAQDPDGEIALIYRDVARKMAAELVNRAAAGVDQAPTIEISDD